MSGLVCARVCELSGEEGRQEGARGSGIGVEGRVLVEFTLLN